MRVLLVDDDNGVNFLNRFLLEHSGMPFEIQVALNGQEALVMIEKGTWFPDVILLDVNMPVMDGFEFLQALKTKPEYYNKAMVYMLTSSLRDSDREAALSFTCVKRYLEKPLSEQVIEELFKS